MPAVFHWHLDPAGELEVQAEDGSGPNSDRLGFLATRLWDGTGPGLPETAGLLGLPLRDARLRLDDVPSFRAGWMDDVSGTAFGFDTGLPDAPLFLGGAQLALSTAEELVVPLPTPGPASAHYARFRDLGPEQDKRIDLGTFGVDEIAYGAADGPGERLVTLHARTDHDRPLTLGWDTAFGGRFFPEIRLMANLLLVDVPQALDVSTDLVTGLDVTASDPVDRVAVDGLVDLTDDDESADAIDFHLAAEGLPTAAALQVTPSTGAELTMDGPAGAVEVALASGEPMLGSRFRRIEAALHAIPAHWSAAWGGPWSLEARDAMDQPAALGSVTAFVSTATDPSETDERLALFTDPGPSLGGPVLEDDGTGCRVEYTPFAQEIDRRYYAGGGVFTVPPRLRRIYCHSSSLDLGADHLAARQGSHGLERLSFALHGFQKAWLDLSEEDGETVATIEARVPVAGAHPLFVGLEDGQAGSFTTVAVEDVPTLLQASIDTGERQLFFHTSSSAGAVDVYRGPLPIAGQAANALRLTVRDLPSEVLLTWDPSESGGVTLQTAPDPFEVGFLQQDAGQRVVGAFETQNLAASWDLDVIDAEVEVDLGRCIRSLLPLYPEKVCGTFFLDYARVGFSGQADPGADGFLNVYRDRGDLQPLDPPGPAPHGLCRLSGNACVETADCLAAGQTCTDETCSVTGHECSADADCADPCRPFEYVPRFTVLARHLTDVGASAGITQCLSSILFPGACRFRVSQGPVPPGAVGFDFDLDADDLTWDFWDFGESPHAITKGPDYASGVPWHVLPVLHHPDDHLEPFDDVP